MFGCTQVEPSIQRLFARLPDVNHPHPFFSLFFFLFFFFLLIFCRLHVLIRQIISLLLELEGVDFSLSLVLVFIVLKLY